MALCACIAICLVLPQYTKAQPSDRTGPSTDTAGGVRQGQTSTTIGESGYKVVIPEIKMKQLFGGRPKADTPKEEAPGPTGQEAAPASEQYPAPSKRPEPIIQVPQIERLPFDPGEKRIIFGPTRSGTTGAEKPQPAADSRDRHAPEPKEVLKGQPPGVTPEPLPQEKPVAPAPLPPAEPLRKEEVRHGPPAAKEAPTRVPGPPRESQGAEIAEPRTPVDSRERGKEDPASIMKPPKAPEDAISPPPPPRKEVLRRGATPGSPPLVQNAPAKETRSALSIGKTEVDELADPREWIPLEPRREAEIIPQPEPAREPETPAPPQTQTPARPPVELQRATPPEPPREPPPEPAPLPQPMRPPVEALPSPEPEEPVEATVPPKESVPGEELRPPPPKELLPSPLEDDARQSREVREYLKQAAPVLEELSLLMTRAPSLALADYDPSEPGNPTIPPELKLKMEALRRELQILDSKSFSIIPPRKYAQFHSLIRDSIAQTHQACDAIIRYLGETNPQNLQSVQEHLRKARALIQRTRERSDRG